MYDDVLMHACMRACMSISSKAGFRFYIILKLDKRRKLLPNVEGRTILDKDRSSLYFLV